MATVGGFGVLVGFGGRVKNPAFRPNLQIEAFGWFSTPDFSDANSPPVGSINHARDPISTHQTPFSTRPEAHFHPPKRHFQAFVLIKLWYVPQFERNKENTRLVFSTKCSEITKPERGRIRLGAGGGVRRRSGARLRLWRGCR